MATIVAEAAGGNWSVGATWVGGVAPTAADDAQLTAASGNVTIDNTSCVCRSLDCTGYTGTLTMGSSRTLTIGDGTAGAGNIALKLVAGMTFAPVSSVTSIIVFASTSGTQQSITNAGKILGSYTFSGAGSSYTFTDNLTTLSGGAILLTAGTLDLSGVATITSAQFVTNGSTAKALVMPTTSWTTNSSWSAQGSNFTYTCGSAFIQVATSFFNSATGTGADTYNELRMTNGASHTITANTTTFATVTKTGTSSKTNTVSLAGDLTVTGTLTITGNSSVNRVLLSSSVPGTQRTVSAGTVTVTNIDLADINGAGAGSWNISAITGLSGDAGGNSNITFTSPITNYMVGSSGTVLWETAARWANSSGGVSGTGRVPLPQDDAVVDANSGTATAVGMTMPRLGKNLSFDKSGMSITMSVSLTCYGTFDIIAASGITNTGTLTLAGRGTHTLSFAGITFPNAITVSAPGGTYTLASAITSSSTMTFSDGTLDTDDFAMTATRFTSNSGRTRAVDLGTSTLTITDTAAATVWSFATAGLTLTASSSTIVIGTASANTRTFAGGVLTYGTLTYTVAGSTGALTITSNNSFDTINFSDVTNARTLNLGSNSITTIRTAFNVNGTAGKLMSITGVAGGGAETLIYTGVGDVSCDYLNVTNSTATPGSTWYAGANSTDSGGNSGWIFTVPPPPGNMLSMVI